MTRHKEIKAHEDDLVVSEEVYKLARLRADEEMAKLREEIESVRQESYIMGAIKAFDANIAQNEFLKIMALYRIKQAKDYKTGGLTWSEFCDAVGVPQRSADRMIEEAKPLFESFSASAAELCGVPFNKIRMLGKSISANLAEIKDNCLIYGDESIPLTPEYRDDIQALIERIGEDAKEKVETLEATVSAKDKVLKSKGDVINKMERELKRFEKDAAAKGLTPDEDAYIQQINNLKTGFDGYLLRLENYTTPDEYEPLNPLKKAALISATHYMKMRILALHDTVTMEFGNPVTNPEILEEFEAWERDQAQTQPQKK